MLTSNRDEAPGRETFPPKIYKEGGVHLLYPKDSVAGGTWIGVSDKKRLVSLMNGGFVSHKRKDSYRKSRGVVVKDFLIADDFDSLIKDYDFSGIEPFTAVVVEWQENLELKSVVWDEYELHFINQPISPRIWSSSPLYNPQLKMKREQWFSDFLNKQDEISDSDILKFHKTAGDGDPLSDLIMDRGFVKTKSITQINKTEEGLNMRYEDLQAKEITNTKFEL